VIPSRWRLNGFLPEHSNVDLASELIEQIRAEMAIDMNAKVIHTANGMVCNLIDQA
ncbi:uncharacterized protein METZ01_LOCUS418556, partial [marine metagenome]